MNRDLESKMHEAALALLEAATSCARDAARADHALSLIHI